MLLRTVYSLTTILLLFVVGCESQSNISTTPQGYQSANLNRSNLVLANVSGFRIAMSIDDASRVLRSNGWRLDTPYTSIDDIKMKYATSTGLLSHLDQDVHYARPADEKNEKIWLTFCGNRLMWVRFEFDIEEEEFEAMVERARSDIANIGMISADNWTDELNYQVSYNPHKLGYFYYSIHKLVAEQSGYHVWLTLHDRSHCH